MNTNFTLTPFHKLPIDGATGLHFDVQFDRYFDSAESRDASIEFGGLKPKSGKSRPRPPEDNRSISINDYDGFVEAANFEATLKAMQAEEQASAEFIYTPPPPDYLDVEQIPVDAINKPHVDDYIEITPATFTLGNYSYVEDLSEMKKQALNAVFVLAGIALLGQLTTIYAKPNTGKTLLVLWMLKESIKAGLIKGEDVFYINADDSEAGLIAKGYIAKQYGFHMLAPGYKGFKSDDLVSHLNQLISNDTARGSIVVLDTLKKFTDLMHKTKGSAFMVVAREFVMKGGTIIMLAHANKNRGADGKIIAGGTSDIGDDGDCVYLLDEVSKTPGTKTVLFENVKKRGGNIQELSFSYAANGDSYGDLIQSVQALDFETTTKAKKDVVINARLEKDAVTIKAIIEGITLGEHKVADLLLYAKGEGVSDVKARDVLKRYTGEKLSNSSLWRVQVGDKNAKIYYLLLADNSTADDYETAKNG